MRNLFVAGSLDEQMQNEKKLIQLATAKVGVAVLCFVFLWRILT